MEAQILLNGISFDELKQSIRSIVQSEVQEAVEILTAEPTDKTPKLLTRKQTAIILGVSLVTLHEWTKNGTIPGKRIGRNIRFEESDVYNSLKDIKTIKYRRS